MGSDWRRHWCWPLASTHICMHTHRPIRTHTCTYSHTCMHTFLQAHAHALMHKLTHKCIHMHIHAHMPTHKLKACTCAHIDTCLQMHTLMLTCTRSHTNDKMENIRKYLSVLYLLRDWIQNFKELFQLKKMRKSCVKMSKTLNGYISEEEMASKSMERYPMSIVIREMHEQATVRNHFILIKMSTARASNNQGWEKRGDN